MAKKPGTQGPRDPKPTPDAPQPAPKGPGRTPPTRTASPAEALPTASAATPKQPLGGGGGPGVKDPPGGAGGPGVKDPPGGPGRPGVKDPPGGDALKAGDAVITTLSSSLPLALFPVRIETRFIQEDQSKNLKVRVYPDVIHNDALIQGLEAEEVTLGRRYWSKVWPLSTTPEAMTEAFSWLCAQLTAWRAAWVARQTRPLNWAARGTAPQPNFGGVPPRVPDQPGVARLMPDRWLVRGYRSGAEIFSVAGSTIPANLPLTPDFVSGMPAPADVTAFLGSQNLSWLSSFDEALALGMALDIIVDNETWDQGLDLLVVTGVQDPEGADPAQDLRALLEAQHYTRGVDFIPAGTPTNNTEGVETGISVYSPDPAEVYAAAVNIGPPRSESPQVLSRQRFADGAGVAFGLSTPHILDSTLEAGNHQLNFAAAMNATLWPTTWGYTLNSMLNVSLSASTLNALRQHFIDYVRGSGPLGTLRIGAQPYGVLPVMAIKPRSPGNFLNDLENLLNDLTPYWQGAISNIPHLNPDATDGTSTSSVGAAVASVAQILGAQPHPALLSLREVEDLEDAYALQFGLLAFFLDAGGVPAMQALEDALAADLAAATTLEEMTLAFQSYAYQLGVAAADSSYSAEDRTQATNLKAYIDDYFLPFLQTHQARIDPVLDLGVDRGEVTGKVQDKSDPTLFHGMFSETEEVVTVPPVAPEGEGESAAEIALWMRALLTEAQGGAAATWIDGNPSLLFQLIKRSIAVVQPADEPDFLQGLEALVLTVEGGQWPQTAETLEQLMRETLGLATHRLDAWATSIATRRLGSKRQTQPQGLQVGSWGVVTDLKRRTVPPSQGYIFTPSLNHATTAAVLRSGWSAMGDGSPTAPLAVDLTSDRIRRAEWIISGVGEGQDLGDLLGYRFERTLHDRGLDAHIAPIREAVSSVLSPGGIQDGASVDGLALARAFTADDTSPQTATEVATQSAVQAVIATSGDAAALQGALDDLISDMDAVADALMAQSVHSLLQGNTATASAGLSAMGSGSASLPRPTLADTQRAGVSVYHRVALVLPETAVASGWAAGTPLGLAEPRLEAWAAELLGSPDQYTYRLTLSAADGSTTVQSATLADLGLGALEAVFAAPPGGELSGSHLEALALIHGRLTLLTEGGTLSVQLENDAPPGEDTLAVEDFCTLASVLGRTLHLGRALDASDLAAPGVTLTSTQESAELVTRVDALYAALTTARDALEAALPLAGETEARGDVQGAMLALAGFGFSGSIPTAGDSDRLIAEGDADDAAALIAEGQALLARVDARIAEGDALATGSEAATVSGATERLRQLLGRRRMPILPLFTAVGAVALDANFGNTASRISGEGAPMAWLSQAGRVRPRVGVLMETIDLAEAAMDEARVDLEILQLPDHPSEGWVAESATVEPGKSRLSLVALKAGGVTLSDAGNAQRVAGLMFDTWTETIPVKDTVAGIAAHFDAPSSKAPQAILLAMIRGNETWNADTLFGLILQTVEQLKQRAVGPESLEGLGQYLPSIYLSSTTIGAAT